MNTHNICISGKPRKYYVIVDTPLMWSCVDSDSALELGLTIAGQNDYCNTIAGQNDL